MLEKKKQSDYLRFWIGKVWKNEKHEQTIKLSWNEYQHLLKALREYKNQQWREENGIKGVD